MGLENDGVCALDFSYWPEIVEPYNSTVAHIPLENTNAMPCGWVKMKDSTRIFELRLVLLDG